MSLPEGGRENKRKKDHEDGHHCLVPLFFLFLICAMLVLQVSKVEKLHKVAHTGQLHFVPNGLVKVGQVGRRHRLRPEKPTSERHSVLNATAAHNSEKPASRTTTEVVRRRSHRKKRLDVDDSVFGNMRSVRTTTLNAASKSNMWWVPPGYKEFSSANGREAETGATEEVAEEPASYQPPNPSFVYLEKVKPLCRGSNEGPFPLIPDSAGGNPQRVTPSFVIIGGPKGGIRSLFNNIMLHPAAIGPKCADTKFFSTPKSIKTGLSSYLQYFPAQTSQRSSQEMQQDFFTGEASAEYFQKLHVPKAISQMLPEVKIIASLRNPTDAFISKWLQVIKSDPKRVQAFEDKTGKPYHCDNVFREQMLDFKRCAVTGQDDIWSDSRDRECVFQIKNLVSQGVYVDVLSTWFDIIPPKQWHIMGAENMFASTKQEMSKVAKFLGVSDYPKDVQDKFVRLGSRNLYDEFQILRDSGSSLTGTILVLDGCSSPVTRKHVTCSACVLDGKPFQTCDRASLDDFFRPFNEQLMFLLRDLLPKDARRFPQW